MFLKTDSFAQHCWKDHKNSHYETDSENDWKAQHVVCLSNKYVSKLIHKNDAKFVD